MGRSHECDYPPEVEKLPVCTRPRFDTSGNSLEIDTLVKECLGSALSVYEVFDDVLEQLQPTHILTQTQCEVCAVSLKDVQRSVAGRLRSNPCIVALEPNWLEDIWSDINRVAASVGMDGEPTVVRLRERASEISERAHQDPKRPSVACIEWIEPLMAAGNWVPELVQMSNGRNLFGFPGKHSPWMEWQDLRTADPEIVVIMPCGFPIDRTVSEMHWLESRPGFRELRAVRERRVYLADGNQYFNRPGPRVVDSLQILAEILHPETVSPQLEGIGFVPFTPAASCG